MLFRSVVFISAVAVKRFVGGLGITGDGSRCTRSDRSSTRGFFLLLNKRLKIPGVSESLSLLRLREGVVIVESMIDDCRMNE